MGRKRKSNIPFAFFKKLKSLSNEEYCFRKLFYDRTISNRNA